MSQNPKRDMPAGIDNSEYVSRGLNKLLVQIRQSSESVKEWAENDLINQFSRAFAGLPQCEIDDPDEVKRFLFPGDEKICPGAITDFLFKQLNSECLQMRRAALQVVKFQPVLLVEYISPMLYHREPEIRKLAVELIQFCEHDEARYWLHGIMLEDQCEQIVGCAVEALAASGDCLTLPLLNRVAARYHCSDYIQFAVAYTRQVLLSKTAQAGNPRQ